MVISVIEPYHCDYIILCNILRKKLNPLYLTYYCYDIHAKLDCGVIGGGESDDDVHSYVI